VGRRVRNGEVHDTTCNLEALLTTNWQRKSLITIALLDSKKKKVVLECPRHMRYHTCARLLYRMPRRGVRSGYGYVSGGVAKSSALSIRKKLD
jgi:hypothetical protein